MNNGYTTININGQAIGIKFGWGAIKEFAEADQKRHDVYYSKINVEGKEVESLTYLGIAKLLQCGYKNNCDIKEVDPVLTLEDFNDWVEGTLDNAQAAEELTKVLNVFSESKLVKVGQRGDEEVKKKKTGSKKSNVKSLQQG
jgi:hypothetical protein